MPGFNTYYLTSYVTNSPYAMVVI